MVDALKYLQSAWLRHEDIADDEPVDVTIKAVKPGKYKKDDAEEKPHLDVLFEEYAEPLGLNNKNLKQLVELLGRDTEGWVGRRVTLVVRVVEVGGEEKHAIRIADELPTAKRARPTNRPAKKRRRPAPDDDRPAKPKRARRAPRDDDYDD